MPLNAQERCAKTAIKQSLTEDLGDVGVVHVGARLQDLPPLVLGPDHEGVHRPLDVRLSVAVLAGLPDYLGAEHFHC